MTADLQNCNYYHHGLSLLDRSGVTGADIYILVKLDQHISGGLALHLHLRV